MNISLPEPLSLAAGYELPISSHQTANLAAASVKVQYVSEQDWIRLNTSTDETVLWLNEQGLKTFNLDESTVEQIRSFITNGLFKEAFWIWEDGSNSKYLLTVQVFSFVHPPPYDAILYRTTDAQSERSSIRVNESSDLQLPHRNKMNNKNCLKSACEKTLHKKGRIVLLISVLLGSLGLILTYIFLNWNPLFSNTFTAVTKSTGAQSIVVLDWQKPHLQIMQYESDFSEYNMSVVYGAEKAWTQFEVTRYEDLFQVSVWANGRLHVVASSHVQHSPAKYFTISGRTLQAELQPSCINNHRYGTMTYIASNDVILICGKLVNSCEYIKADGADLHWTKLDVPKDVCFFKHAAVEYKSGMLVSGGRCAGKSASNEVWAFDFESNNWQRQVSMRKQRALHALASDSHQTVYACGGDNGLASCEKFNGEQWLPLPDMPSAQDRFQMLSVGQGQLVIVAGFSNFAVSGPVGHHRYYFFDGLSWVTLDMGEPSHLQYSDFSAVVVPNEEMMAFLEQL